jgi:hypothetical protein
VLLSFTRRGEMPLGKMSDRLMVHPASITTTVDRSRRRVRDPSARRARPAADPGRHHGGRASRGGGGHGAAEQIQFGLGMLDETEAATVNRVLRPLRAGDMAEGVADAWT